MTSLQRINLLLRVLMETGIVLGLGYWGYHFGETQAMKIGLLFAAPVIGFGIWGAVDFHQLGPKGEWFRLVQELLISGLAAFLLVQAGVPVPLFGWILAILSVAHHVLVYAIGDRLLKQK